MNRHPFPFSPFGRALLFGGVALTAFGCSREPVLQAVEIAYVRGVGVPLRDQLGPSSGLVGTLQSGEKVEVLAKRLRWVQVRSARGQKGWVQSRLLVSQPVYDQFRRLAREADALPSQGKALIQRETNLYLGPSRDAETFYQLPEREEVEVLGHRAVERTSRLDNRQEALDEEVKSVLPAAAQLEVKGSEDWLLVGASGGRAGWLLENFLDMNLPVEMAQYREGLRVRAWFAIHKELDQGEERPWYLWATIRSLRGLPFDFDEIRVFVWNPMKSRYETAYRERNLIGFYPLRVGSRETTTGPAPTLSLQLEDQTGERFQKNYIMVGRQVRREP